MKISQAVAQSIVDEISKTVDKNVNLMDDKGYILASTNPQRIGTQHVGARKIIEEKLECLTIETDQEYSGAKMGINMPIYFHREMVGVIGISGEWSQITQYVQLIRKATEVLLMDSYLRQKDDGVKMQQHQYLHALLCGETANLTKSFINSELPIGQKLTVPRRCICVAFTGKSSACARETQPLLDDAERLLEHGCAGDAVLYRELTQLCAFVPDCSNVEMIKTYKRMCEQLKMPAAMCLKMGVDDRARVGAELRISKAKAEKSVKSAMGNQNENLVFYAAMTLGIFASEVSPTTKKEYIGRVFCAMDERETQNWVRLLETFYACEGSITKAAEKLFVHKNTLQYQLKKLAMQTGYDPRSISTAALYQNAIAFWNT